MATNTGVSIIVPVYNAASSLERCLDSLIGQTFPHIQIVLVDDGSTDSSYGICHRYQQKDSRVCVFRKSNGGVSEARNYGMDRAVMPYIMFVDSDDYVDPEICQELLNAVSGKGYMSSMCGFSRHFMNQAGRITCTQNTLPESTDLLTREDLKQYYGTLLHKSILASPWCKLFSTELIREKQLKFATDISLGEDTLFILSYLLHDCRFAVVNQSLYHYMCINTSLTQAYNPNRLYYSTELFKRSIKFAEELDMLCESSPFIAKMYLKNCFIGMEQASKTATEAKHIFQSIITSETTRQALAIKKPGDPEYLIYQILLKTGSVLLLRMAVRARLCIKNWVRG